MRAFQLTAYDGPDALALIRDAPAPRRGDDEVLLDVEAIGINFPDLLCTRGQYQLRPDPPQLCDLWHQLVDALLGLARQGLTHGDLSAYNLLVHEGRLVLIDLPQVVDVIGNPQGPAFLARDAQRMAEWFIAHGLSADAGPGTLLDELHAELGMPPAAGASDG